MRRCELRSCGSCASSPSSTARPLPAVRSVSPSSVAARLDRDPLRERALRLPAHRRAAADRRARGRRNPGADLGRESKLDLRPGARSCYACGDGVDVVHAHMFGSNVWGTVLGRLTGRPGRSSRTSTPGRSRGRPAAPLPRPRARRALRGRLRRRLRRGPPQDDRGRRRRCARKIRLVPNGIPDPPGDGSAPTCARSSGSSRTRPSSGSSASCGPRRRSRCCSRQPRSCCREFPALKVLVAGDGPERDRLETAVKAARS